MTTHHQPQENGLAIASLVLGITSIVAALGPLTGIPAIVTGVMGMKNPHNKGMAVAGLVMGIVSTAVSLLLLLLFIMIFMFAAAAALSHPDYNDANQPESSKSSSYQQQI